MKQISSRFSRFSRLAFPVSWLALLALAAVLFVTTGVYEQEPMVLVVPVIMAAIGFVLWKLLLSDLVDEVHDAGTYLLVKNRGQQERIELADIVNINTALALNPPRVSLRLRRPGKFGDEVTFTPIRRLRFNPFARDPLIEDLIARVDHARRSAAR